MNVGTVDALVRLVVGWLLLHWSIVFKVQLASWLKWVMIILGAVLVITAVTRYCAIYTLFNFSTF